MHITASVVSAYEHGSREPKAAILLKMLAALGVGSVSLDSPNDLNNLDPVNEHAGQRQRKPLTKIDRSTRGGELLEVLELAAHFPARHASKLTYPIFGKPR